MRFYKLTHPDYATDRAADMANPIRMVNELYVPGITCSACGESWASSDRVRVSVPKTSDLRAYLTGKCLPESEWRAFAEKLRRELTIPSWMKVTPGAQIGLPTGELSTSQIPDMMHPFPGQIIAQNHVVQALEKEKLTGFFPVRVQVRWSERVMDRDRDAPAPELYELLVKGVAWRVGVDTNTITICPRCGRTVFANVAHFDIDTNRWDGSDFFHVDQNPNIILVTERVCMTLAEYNYTNYTCAPVS